MYRTRSRAAGCAWYRVVPQTMCARQTGGVQGAQGCGRWVHVVAAGGAHGDSICEGAAARAPSYAQVAKRERLCGSVLAPARERELDVRSSRRMRSPLAGVESVLSAGIATVVNHSRRRRALRRAHCS
jgi:hypothetical protein